MTHLTREPFGLYHPRQDQDACGIGFVADIDGRRTHAILRQALGALANLAHRGAVSADGRSGDGAGVQTQIPLTLFRKVLAERDIKVKRHGFGVGMLFLPPDRLDEAQQLIEGVLDRTGLPLLAWRRVPVGEDALGERARRSLPGIFQVIVGRPDDLDGPSYERRLYLARKRIESGALAAGLGGLYVPSMSHRTVVYKGLMVAGQLDRFYLDLADPDYRTAIALFHQRYSTNTFPTWSLAQPFRMLGHNGEINTLLGNLNWMTARERELRSSVWGEQIDEILPLIQKGGSDSAALDNVFELLTVSGRDPLHAMLMLIPEAYQGRSDLDPEVVGFYEYHSCLLEPWDGPAAVVFSDGRYAAAVLDRNGLRPQRYWVTSHGIVIVGSEAGIMPKPPELVVQKGRLGPGEMLAVDTVEGRLLDDRTIKRELAARRPYRVWVDTYLVRGPKMAASSDDALPRDGELAHTQRLFGYGKEDVDSILVPMLYEGREPIGSMGDDTPVAVLSTNPQPLYRYFKQRFAQVTNPPIDPLRERCAMSLATATGSWGLLLDERPEFAHLIEFSSPVLSSGELEWMESLGGGHASDPAFKSARLRARFPVASGEEGLEPAVEALCAAAEQAVDEGATLLVLSHRECDERYAPIPMLLGTSAVHHHLIRARKRMQASLVCDTADAWEDHHIACLIGYGATLVHPYLAYASVAAAALADPRESGITPDQALGNYRATLEKGLLKIMSKMGIGPVSSYQGAQIFEAIGLSPELVERHFVGTECRIGGVGMRELARDVLSFHSSADEDDPGLPDRGVYRFRKDGEYHDFNPLVFKALHKAVRTGSGEAYEEYARLVDERPPSHLRDLLEWRPLGEAIPPHEVETAEEIARRFCTQAMSHGAISSETHESLAVAMNRLGGKSNSGEGGEDRSRFYPFEEDQTGRGNSSWYPHAGDWANSAIKQVASGRFGVKPEYLVNAREIEIKMAQGSKPGEGGQIPGHKVTAEIAAIRGSVPGVTLISPPPHHDIYSIEDLAQLIYDLKRVNRRATICVKLVSVVGVGTVAAGVAKGYADSIQISGHDGGTGASPLSSIKNAGLPWELGLAETQQVLVLNDLRERVTLRVDGGLKTGRDIVVAALLGADEYGFGTAPLVSLGCIMARQCHLNTCPVGIATQRQELRERFPGKPEHVISFMLFVAEQVRQILARMGARSLQEIIGRVDLLSQRELPFPKGKIDLAAVLADPDPERVRPRHRRWPRNDRPDNRRPLDEQIWLDFADAVDNREPMARSYEITNRERTLGARLSGEIARRYRDVGLAPGSLDITLRGAAGQSFGAFCNTGMRLTLCGEAQDYVGKGMHGGEIVLLPPAESQFASHTAVIAGNTVLYGATGGSLYAAGRAGERLCVRNSGARAVIEGCGDHGCEYMTGGIVVILGQTGRNFGAGMSGGVAYVLDLDGGFPERFNPGMVAVERLADEIDIDLPRIMIERHFDLTQSKRAAWILDHWAVLLPRFWKVLPHPGMEEHSERDQDARVLRTEALRAVRDERRLPEPRQTAEATEQQSS